MTPFELDTELDDLQQRLAALEAVALELIAERDRAVVELERLRCDEPVVVNRKEAAMPAKQVPLNQTSIPLPSQAGRVVAELTEEDREREYARLMGENALARQRALAEQERTCSCGKGAVPVRLHAVGCKARPLTKSGNRR